MKANQWPDLEQPKVWTLENAKGWGEANTVLIVCLSSVECGQICSWNFIRVRISKHVLSYSLYLRSWGQSSAGPLFSQLWLDRSQLSYHCFTDKSPNSKSTSALETSAKWAASIRACTLSEIAVGSRSCAIGMALKMTSAEPPSRWPCGSLSIS